MTGAEHYREAERLSDAARDVIKRADAARDVIKRADAARDVIKRADAARADGGADVQWLDAHGAARNLIDLAHVHATLALASATAHPAERCGEHGASYGPVVHP